MTPQTVAPGPVFARLDRPRSDSPTTLAVVADPHVALTARGTWKVYHRTLERLRSAVAIANEHADAALLAGDLTRDGHSAEFDAVDDALGDLDVPWYAVPGNHDVPKAFDDHTTPPVERFAERYDPLPFAREVGELTLLGVDTATSGVAGLVDGPAVDSDSKAAAGGPTTTDDDRESAAEDDRNDVGDLRDTWGGRVGPAQRAWLAEQLAAADQPVVALHHPAARLPDCPDRDRWRNFSLRDGDAVSELLRRHDVPLVLSAHHHVPALCTHGGTVEALAPATCSFPQASLHVEVGPDGTTLRLVPLTDRAGVAEAHGLARDGSPLGQTVVELVERRLSERLDG
ncbi:metallophosphoesterase family protein [Halosimplex aquaticum]|uniref:Metallophosphoesterase family protein n=1 Tax=Halosimplex aquaticum TaxID=3026162 RepID=A0ABD5Y1T4_9EURY|nr:metallophosphoesterase [Halosimplex aquaticum]